MSENISAESVRGLIERLRDGSVIGRFDDACRAARALEAYLTISERVGELEWAVKWALRGTREPRLIPGQNDQHCADYARALAALSHKGMDQ